MKVYAVRGGGGLRLHVREWRKADGPRILFIHGWSQTISACRRQYKSALADEFLLVAYDLRGHGSGRGRRALWLVERSLSALTS